MQVFSAHDFLAAVTQHIPLQGLHYIRRYGLGAPVQSAGLSKMRISDEDIGRYHRPGGGKKYTQASYQNRQVASRS